MSGVNDESGIPIEAQGKTTELLEPADYGEYLLRGANDIRHLLYQLLDRGCQITIFFNEGHDLILTTLVAVTDNALIFDYGASAETNQRALAAAKLFSVTTLDKVKVQFILQGLKSTTYEGRPAFISSWPDSVLRLQRREYFRLTMPLTRRLTCQVPLEDSQRIEVDVVDLSGGGLSLVTPPESVHFEPEMKFPDCRIELPEVGMVIATIQVVTIFEITLRNGARVKRTGCRFVDLPGTMNNLIQRYIIKIERERKARESGLV